ncbi:MAG: general secretion pathway protein GspK [Candidatus Omnitrophota bacterium]
MFNKDARSSTRGSILVIALWSLCLLATFAVCLGYSVRQKATMVHRLEERDSLRLIAEAGVKKAIAEIRKEEHKTYDTLGDAWSNSVVNFKNIALGGGTADVCYEYPDESGLTGVQYGMIDEERKININTANATILRRFFRMALGFNQMEAQNMAARIIDWRDKDTGWSIPFGSAEDSDYGNLPYPYGAKDWDFEVPDELLLVKDITPELYDRMKNYVTVYGSGKVNINTAPGVVLLSLGLRKDMVAAIIAFRNGADNVAGTLDDGFFVSSTDVPLVLARLVTMSHADINKVGALLENSISTTSDYFEVRSLARIGRSRNTLEAVCVIDRGGKILNWRES